MMVSFFARTSASVGWSWEVAKYLTVPPGATAKPFRSGQFAFLSGDPDRAIFNLAVGSKLRRCYLVVIKSSDIAVAERLRHPAGIRIMCHTMHCCRSDWRLEWPSVNGMSYRPLYRQDRKWQQPTGKHFLISVD